MKCDRASIPTKHGNTKKPAERTATQSPSDSGTTRPEASTAFSQWTEEVMVGMKLMHDDSKFLDCITAKSLSKCQLRNLT